MPIIWECSGLVMDFGRLGLDKLASSYLMINCRVTRQKSVECAKIKLEVELWLYQ